MTNPEEIIGKTIVVGVTYENSAGGVIAQKQWAGTITAFDEGDGIQIIDDSGEYSVFPPDLSAIRPAQQGVYTLKESGRVVHQPDFEATWTCVEPDRTEG